jgi:hypothetical protein
VVAVVVRGTTSGKGGKFDLKVRNLSPRNVGEESDWGMSETN